MKVAKGSTVGDVGAGSGYMSLRLARLVGAEGKVYAVDVQPGMLQLLQQNAAKAKLTNVVPVLGAFDDPKLPAATLDLIIMVDVYHEFSQPQRMLQRMREALKPGGRLALFEYRAEDPDVPILPLHKMTKAQVKTEVEAEGFKQTRVFDDLPWQHLIVFTTERVKDPQLATIAGVSWSRTNDGRWRAKVTSSAKACSNSSLVATLNGSASAASRISANCRVNSRSSHASPCAAAMASVTACT